MSAGAERCLMESVVAWRADCLCRRDRFEKMCKATRKFGDADVYVSVFGHGCIIAR